MGFRKGEKKDRLHIIYPTEQVKCFFMSTIEEETGKGG